MPVARLGFTLTPTLALALSQTLTLTLARLHVGLYGFRAAALHRLVALPPSPLEVLERLEQLRAIEAGMHIVVGRVASAPHGVDTEADLRAVQGPGFRAIDGA